MTRKRPSGKGECGCSNATPPDQKGTSEMKRTRRRPAIAVTTGAKGVVAHAGARLLCDLADDVGLTETLSDAMSPTKKRRRGHDRGEVLVDLAVALADGATSITDIRVLADQPSLFGEVASAPTVWRTLEAIDEETLGRIASARAAARRRAWAAGMDPGFYVIDIDGTLVDSHSEKEEAAPTYKHGFGFYPLMAYLDATGESLAGLLRPGNAGSSTAADHVKVLDAALFQLPKDPKTTEVICRTDTAGCSHEFLDAVRTRGLRVAQYETTVCPGGRHIGPSSGARNRVSAASGRTSRAPDRRAPHRALGPAPARARPGRRAGY